MTDLLEHAAEAEPAAPTPEPPDASDVPVLARVLGSVGRAMIITGIIVFLFVAFQLWGTDIQEARAQDELNDDLASRFDTAAADFDPALFAVPADPTADDPVIVDDASDDDAEPPADEAVADEPAPDEVDLDLLALFFPDEGDALAKIEIPSIDVEKVVVRGVAVADLRKGPGHYSQTALPGNPGNAAIAGHRTTYGSPFNRIDELVPGDEITVTSIQGEFTYRVIDPIEAYSNDLERVDEIGDGHIIVHPSSTWVLGEFGDDRLTLTACHPKLSSRQRIIVAAELVDAPVQLPEWAVEAEAERQAEEATDEQLGADGTNDVAEPVEETDTPVDDEPDADDIQVAAPPLQEPDLDEGLNGERDAIPPAAGWMLGAVALWYAGGHLGRRFGANRLQRWGARFAGLVPAALCLWFSFELIDRALPAG